MVISSASGRPGRSRISCPTMPGRLAMLLALVICCAVGGCGSAHERVPAGVQQIDVEAGTFTGESAHPGTMVCGYRAGRDGWRCGPCRDEHRLKSVCPPRQPLTLTIIQPSTVREIVNELNRFKRERLSNTSCELPDSTQGLLTMRLRSHEGGTAALVTFMDLYPPGYPSDGEVPADCEPLLLNVGSARQVALISGDYSRTLGHLLDMRLP